jgi:hypothetical protein
MSQLRSGRESPPFVAFGGNRPGHCRRWRIGVAGLAVAASRRPVDVRRVRRRGRRAGGEPGRLPDQAEAAWRYGPGPATRRARRLSGGSGYGAVDPGGAGAAAGAAGADSGALGEVGQAARRAGVGCGRLAAVPAAARAAAGHGGSAPGRAAAGPARRLRGPGIGPDSDHRRPRVGQERRRRPAHPGRAEVPSADDRGGPAAGAGARPGHRARVGSRHRARRAVARRAAPADLPLFAGRGGLEASPHG